MKNLIICLLVAFASIGYCCAQENEKATGKLTSDLLRQKYSKPVSEIFLVRPNIQVTVSYDERGQTKEMIIEPKNDGAMVKSRGRRLENQELKEVIDELIPDSIRGRRLNAGFVNARCLPADDCWGSTTGYKNIVIYYNGGIDRPRYATIQWNPK